MIQEISVCERDRLSAAFGLVSDVFHYYPHGVSFPVYVEGMLQRVVLTPENKGYKLTAKSHGDKKTFHGEDVTDLLAKAIDTAKDLAFAVTYGYDENNVELIPVAI